MIQHTQYLLFGDQATADLLLMLFMRGAGVDAPVFGNRRRLLICGA